MDEYPRRYCRYVDADSTLSLVLTQDTTLTLSAESTGSEIQNTFGIGTVEVTITSSERLELNLLLHNSLC